MGYMGPVLTCCSKPFCRLSGHASFTAYSAFVTADFTSLACVHTTCFFSTAQQQWNSSPYYVLCSISCTCCHCSRCKEFSVRTEGCLW